MGFVRCNKQAHKSKGAAEAHLRHLVRDGVERPKNGQPLVVYPCIIYRPHCGFWHVGHKPLNGKTNRERTRDDGMPF